jgi:hypothetical protein
MSNNLYTLGGHIAALLAEGYDVTFARSPGGSQPFEAYLVRGKEDTVLGDGGTLAEALWAVSPLHGDDVPFIVTDEGARDHDLRVLGDDMAGLRDRVEALEERHDRFDLVEEQLVYTMVDALVRADPDGELARHLRESRAKREAGE